MRSDEYEATHASPPGFTPPGGLVYEYDDGNGLWITSYESPFDLGFSGCASPQCYPSRQGLTSEAREGRGLVGRVEGDHLSG